MMKWRSNSFGGILLELENGNIAVNGGGTLADMEDAYIVNGEVPMAMIVTCEHHQRSHNVDRFCLKHNVPLITTTLCAERLSLEGVNVTLLTVPESKLFVKLGFGISLVPVRYDSVESFFLTINDGNEQIGIVPDGKIYPDLAKYLFDCDTVILGNRLNIPDNAPSALARRLQSVYNTQEELDEIFKNYDGKFYYI
ncbi:MAG: hypothetical protein J6W00_10755 [Lentisphaeria bacterium]|nr:hypothetical protein [Lentisphaeria bacterium]